MLGLSQPGAFSPWREIIHQRLPQVVASGILRHVVSSACPESSIVFVGYAASGTLAFR
jgi:hypothetical protein